MRPMQLSGSFPMKGQFMPEDPLTSEYEKNQKHNPPSKRRFRILGAVVFAGIILWHVAQTEFRVAQLRSDGFSDFVIDSTRNHTYFPLIGAILGVALFIGASLAIKRALGGRRNREEG